MLTLKIRFVEHFKDGTILPQAFSPGQTLDVDEALAGRIQASGGVFEILERRVPPPVDDTGAPLKRKAKAGEN